MKQIDIELYCDGWTVIVDDQRFRWNHNDEDMGTEGIKKLLEYLGHKVTVTKEPLYASSPPRQPLTDEQYQRWAVFCGICRKQWSVPYQHPGKSVCDNCVAAHGIKGEA